MRSRTTFRNKLIERSTTSELDTDTETGHIFHFIRMILQILLSNLASLQLTFLFIIEHFRIYQSKGKQEIYYLPSNPRREPLEPIL